MEFRWNKEKNVLLLQTRNICFEDIIEAIDSGGFLDVKNNPKQERYPWQVILYILYDDYVYEVPAIHEWNDVYFLKTIYPSRKAKKRFSI